MRFVLTSIIWAYSFLICFSQDISKKVELGISVQPQLNISSIGFERVDNKESVGFAVNGDVFFQLGKFLQLNSGIGIQEVYLKHSETNRWPSQNMNGEWVPSEEGKTNFKTNYTFISLPIDFKLHPLKKLFPFFINAGLLGSHKIASGGKIEIKEPGGGIFLSDPDLYDVKSSQVFSTIGLGIEWKGGSKKFFINPVYQASFSDIFSDLSSFHNGKFKFIGLRVGVY